ncbi:hypothetical protein Tco_0691075, partial [Tanacetum coccineum]
EWSGQPTDPQHTSTSSQPSNKEPTTIPSSSHPKKTFKCRKPKKVTEIPQSSDPTTLIVDEAVHKERGDSVEGAATTATTLDAEQDSGGRPRRQETMGDRPAQTRVLDLETTKTAQVKEITNLKKRVKKLERKRKSRIPGMNLFNIGTSRRRSLGEEDASKQDMDHAIKDVKGDEKQVISAAIDEVPTGDAVNTVGTEVNTTSALVTATGVSVSTVESINIASEVTLMKIMTKKSKVRGVVMKEPSKTVTRPIVPPQQHDPKDKGKGNMVEPEKPLKRKDQIRHDEEIAQRLQEELQAKLEKEERMAKKRRYKHCSMG